MPRDLPGLVQPGLCDGYRVTRPSEFGDSRLMSQSMLFLRAHTAPKAVPSGSPSAIPKPILCMAAPSAAPKQRPKLMPMPMYFLFIKCFYYLLLACRLDATDETRAGERGMSPFEQRKMLSGEGTCDLDHSPRVVLWPSGWAVFISPSPSSRQSSRTERHLRGATLPDRHSSE